MEVEFGRAGGCLKLNDRLFQAGEFVDEIQGGVAPNDGFIQVEDFRVIDGPVGGEYVKGGVGADELLEADDGLAGGAINVGLERFGRFGLTLVLPVPPSNSVEPALGFLSGFCLVQ